MTTAALPAGSLILTAAYSGDATKAASTSSPVAHTVNKANTTTGITANPASPTVGQTVNLVASVTPSAATGAVKFFSGSTLLGTSAVSNGQAAFPVAELATRGGDFDEGAKGITKFDRFLQKTNFPERLELIQLFRDLQSLRSTGSAHLKGSAYLKAAAKLSLDPSNKAQAVSRILQNVTVSLQTLRAHYCAPPASTRPASVQQPL